MEYVVIKAKRQRLSSKVEGRDKVKGQRSGSKDVRVKVKVN